MDVFTWIMRGWHLDLGLGVELTLGALELYVKHTKLPDRNYPVSGNG